MHYLTTNEKPACAKTNFDRWLQAGFWLFIIVALFYTMFGLWQLVTGTHNPDLLGRWLEQQYVYRGIAPYDAMGRSPLVAPELGPVKSGGYFAWSFFTASFLIPPGLSFTAARVWFAGLNLIALGWIALFVRGQMADLGPLRARVAVTMVLAMIGTFHTLEMGQYGILVNALLCLMLWLLERGRGAWAGICLGIAMIKPTISGLFLFPLLLRGGARGVATLTLFMAVAHLGIWAGGMDPWAMNLRVMSWLEFAKEGTSLISLGAKAGLSTATAVWGAGVLGLGIAGWGAWWMRHYPLPVQFALAAVIGRLATYHRCYDDIMLMFLLLPLIRLALAAPGRWGHWAVLLVTGATLWTPKACSAPGWVPMAKGVIWIAALGWIMLSARGTPAGASAASSLRSTVAQ